MGRAFMPSHTDHESDKEIRHAASGLGVIGLVHGHRDQPTRREWMVLDAIRKNKIDPGHVLLVLWMARCGDGALDLMTAFFESKLSTDEAVRRLSTADEPDADDES
jgi:hypothetical protein